ncbi:MAG TPA: mechanosensitive ion channel domain-containing protein [Casimicrobiaceae bacterium]|nr:mechanosensitive ion channel domain-containing protein [Casimicrobiaceae bacterium]
MTLYTIVTDLAHVDAMQREIETSLRDTADWVALTKPLDAPALEGPFQALQDIPDPVTNVRYTELRALDMYLGDRLRAVVEAATSIGSLTQRFITQLDRLDREAALWPERAKIAREAQAPLQVQQSVDAVAPLLAELRERLIVRRDELLIAYQRAVRQQARFEAIRAEVSQRRERLWSELRSGVGEPIWRQRSVSFPLDELHADVSLMRFSLADWASRYGARVGFGFVVILGVAFAALRRRSAALVRDDAAPLPAAVALCAAVVIAVASTAALVPPGAPLSFYRLVWFGFPLVAAVVATHAFARAIPATVWTVAFAVFLNQFRVLAELNPVSDWLLLTVQIVSFGVALGRDWRRGALAQAFPRVSRPGLRRLVQADLALLILALALSFVGYLGLASQAVALGVIAPGYAMSFAALAWSLDRFFAGLLSSRLAQTLRSVREQRATMLRTIHNVTNVAAWVAGLAAFALFYSALDDVRRVVALLGDMSVSAGEVTITLRAVASALTVVAITWLVTKLVRFTLDHEMLPRLGLRTGVPIAISTIIGYVLVLIGGVLALAALGVDFTKVTLLAGALGIGVGLGLQNLVSNFASGLILMFERPINVGDQIDVGGVMGEVKRIGVRSSTIRTFQGAEIIVPNADLVSKEVTNWTLSDRARRYDIDVGVAYGADPTQVLKLLETAAASVAQVQKSPAPVAAFTGFGDNALNFRLYAWVESIDVGIQAQNALRTAILAALEHAGIDIPFPQRDVRIRYVPEGAGERKVPDAIRLEAHVDSA